MATPEPTAIAKINHYLSSNTVKARFAEIVGERNSGAYISSVMLAVADSTALQKCQADSIYISALRAATLRLSVDPGLGQAYLVPFKGKAVLIVGYKGLQDMAVRTGKYRYINVGPVYEGEEVEENRISGIHSLTGQRSSRDAKIVGWIAAFELFAGFAHTMYMTIEEIHQHAREYSKGYDYKNDQGEYTSLWHKESAKMERKTVLRLLLRKWGYLDPSDAAVLNEIENEPDSIDAEFSEEYSEQEEPAPHRSEEQNLADLGFAPEPKPMKATVKVEDNVDKDFPPQPEAAPASREVPGPSAKSPAHVKGDVVRPLAPETLRSFLATKSSRYGDSTITSPEQLGLMVGMIEEAFACKGADKIRRSCLRYLWDVGSSKELSGAEVKAMLDWLKPIKDAGGAYHPDPMAMKELTSVWTAAQLAAGQEKLPMEEK